MESQKTTRKCFVCGKGESMRCSACKSVLYCSKKCQKAHWKIHKQTCGDEDENANYKPIGFGKLKSCIESGLGNVELTPQLYELATVKAMKLYPSKTVIRTIDALTMVPEYSSMFIGFIFKFHPYGFRHAVHVKVKAKNH